MNSEFAKPSLICDLLIVLPHLGPGGAQKVALLAADHFIAAGLKVTLVTLLPGKPLAHEIPDGLIWIDLGQAVSAACSNRALNARVWRFVSAWTRRVGALCFIAVAWPWLKSISPQSYPRFAQWLLASLSGVHASLLRDLLYAVRPPRVLSLLSKTNLLCCQAFWDLPAHLVVSERNDPRLQRLLFPWNLLQGWLWKRADCITANTAGVLDGLKSCFPEYQNVMQLLPNPLVLEGLSSLEVASQVFHEELGFLAVCRLVPQKGIDVLIRAYASLPKSLRRDWPLTIAGDGPERPALEKLVNQLLPSGQVQFLGFHDKPMSLHRSSAVFVLPSRFEGMPNALLEAMGSGMAVVVSDASPGPLEVVVDGETGLVFKSQDVHALSLAMTKLALSQPLRSRLGTAASFLMLKQSWDALDHEWRRILAIDQ
ncbi:glycosyltransferase [bacterium]|nr:glycosyltransferase [bacterium]